jgi:hypothetical protein
MSRTWRLLFPVVAVLCAAGAIIAWKPWRNSTPTPIDNVASTTEFGPADDPRLTFSTPYRNVRPEVKYVGDEACAECHGAIAKSYREHPMGRSLGLVQSVADRQRYGRDDGNPFTSGGLEFLVERRGNRVVHRESARDERDRPIVEAEDEVQYVIGSGTRTFSYLSEREGCVFESPITWYTQKQRWDVSPGYGTGFGHFEREAKPGCLFCHCNSFEPVPNSVNRYKAPTFRGMTIGCERCHGPGELHVRQRQADEKSSSAFDDTIVNPKRLEPSLRDGVCQQCHLQGLVRLLRRDRGVLDFRPGLPLHLFWTYYVSAERSDDELQFVSQFEQLQASRCAIASKGALSCTTCHNPHVYPAEKERLTGYRAVCMKCHAERGCTETAARRAALQDSCTACHMQRTLSADIDHTAITNHRILRRPIAAAKPGAKSSGLPRIVSFHQALGGLSVVEKNYDLALALATLPVEKYGLGPGAMMGQAKPLLEEALRRWPNDLEAREAHVYALEIEGRLPEALAETEAILAMSPEREVSLLQAAKFCENLNRINESVGYWQRALQLNPTRSQSHQHLARLYAIREEWAKAVAECLAALRFNPAHIQTRGLLVFALARGGDKVQARIEAERTLALKPPNAEELRAMFAELLR